MRPKIDLLSARNRSNSRDKAPLKRKLSLLKDLKPAHQDLDPQFVKKKTLVSLGGCPEDRGTKERRSDLARMTECCAKEYHSSRKTSTTLSIYSML